MKENNQLKELFKGIGMVLLFFIIPITYQLSLASLFNKNTLLDSILLLIQQIILTTTFVIIYKNRFKDKFKDFKKNKKEYIDLIFKAWLIGFICMVVSNLIINIGLNMGVAGNEETNRKLLKTMWLYSIPSVTLLAPLTEELVFRVSFKNAFKNKKIFIIVTSLIFGSVHLISGFTSIKDLLYIIPYSSLGFSMGYVYAKTDNPLTNILMHMAHNTLTVILYFIVL